MEYSHPIIEDLFTRFGTEIGVDYNRYKNHVYRVFLNCLLLDTDKNNEDKYATAAVFHDIGIWTDHTIDYLNPSIEQARIYLAKINKEDWIGEISLMIYWHHKLSRYQGKHQETVETFRKADWIDVSLGIISFDANIQEVRENRRKLPNLGFHFFLIRETTKNFLSHPLNPLPMFTK